jgi:hypothetical protein
LRLRVQHGPSGLLATLSQARPSSAPGVMGKAGPKKPDLPGSSGLFFFLRFGHTLHPIDVAGRNTQGHSQQRCFSR